MRKSIAIDMDGVIADVEQQFLDWYQRDYGTLFTKDDLAGKNDDTLFPEAGLARRFVLSPGFFLSLPVMDGAVEAVKKLMETYEVYIVSAAMEFPLSLPEKLEWLNINFPFISWRNIVFCGDKSIINTDYMIDDHLKNLDNFKGKTIMFHAYHNVSANHHVRANNWDEVLNILSKENSTK
ncbi:5'(3')-deoxyribonucleotidase [Mucilaginibacter sp. ZT4R22]|uniref:5'(3')-deoxyribonucleotidase n=1 Tax=Mucilaginibacter pankratovii TaxID=2772110 RepID=A0ABR7WPU2_9SPHI|nr:5'(3')-deoxyribonucleotidase [Mucilaginibacter pankratovii]MBD1364315.1 5'(3')-deoxyribonucleotidase [Mucilaginibacter pankratovii]